MVTSIYLPPPLHPTVLQIVVYGFINNWQRPVASFAHIAVSLIVSQKLVKIPSQNIFKNIYIGFGTKCLPILMVTPGFLIRGVGRGEMFSYV